MNTVSLQAGYRSLLEVMQHIVETSFSKEGCTSFENTLHLLEHFARDCGQVHEAISMLLGYTCI